ncbi:glycosyltransferase family 2 protein [Microbulbifer hainanensis]|uniref:glycosyltransferase family 2 protein n=1 Tax=Microbulbifer hainanensis TaxID=2735675 RepID=UPI0018678CF4|nr:glycosyltransferase family 2 protein [Microbulbifer hainanensis]
MSWTVIILSVPGALLLIWNLLWLLELLAALLRHPRESIASAQAVNALDYTVLIPAHNEASVIANTLASLSRQLDDRGSVLVVADNCTDNTAELAQASGARVIERFDSDRRGKGYALRCGLELLAEAPPEIVVVLDADCRFDCGALHQLVACANKRRCPVQCDYRMRVGRGESLSRRVAHFAWRVKNSVRPGGLSRLAMPCQLTGTGMAFPWECIDAQDIPVSSIVEDMVLGVNLARRNQFPSFLRDAVVSSEFPETASAERSQRERWEHGHLATITEIVPKTLMQALRDRNWRLAALCVDLSIPPVSLLAALNFIYFVIAACQYWIAGTGGLLYLSMIACGLLAFAVVAAWWQCGRDLLGPLELLRIPAYIVQKLSVYTGFFTKRQGEWIRTARK